MSLTNSCTPCSDTAALPREVLLPNSDDSGSETNQFDTIMLENNGQEASQSAPENNGEFISGPASSSTEVESHQIPNIVLPTSLNEMYENLMNEIESDVNALIKLPEPLQHFMRSTPPEPTMPPTIAPKPTKAKGFRVEKPRREKKPARRNERRLQAIQAQAEALLTDPDSDNDDTKSPTIECRDEWAAVQRASRLMNPESIRRRPRLVFWTDGSCKGQGRWGHHASAVTYQRDIGKPWVDCAYGIFGDIKVPHTELFAIAMALRIACTETQLYVHIPDADQPDACDGEETLPKVYILTDWREGLNWIERRINNGERLKDKVADEIIQVIQQALDTLGSLGVLVRLCWVPGHIGLEGNVRADTIASKAMRYLCDLWHSPPREFEGTFEAFLVSRGKLTSLEGGAPPDGLYDSGDLENFTKVADAAAPSSSEPNTAMAEGNDEMCEY